jgi:small subunit ribosomal protein S21|tara:strand:+ start:9838 stop:10104 length:267 start_codon:yes stop_codon:yes gene_type:complete
MAKNIKVRSMAQVRDPNEAGLSVVVRGEGEREFMKAMRKFKRKVAESGIINDFRDKQYYEKPSDKKRKAKKQAVRRQQRALLDNKNNY